MLDNPQLAFVLHTRPLNENKQIVDFFTEQDGKLSTASFISQSKKSDKNALLQPFTPLTINVSGASNLKKLKFVEAADNRFLLQKKSLYCGFYLNELLTRLLPEQIECRQLFSQYVMSLKQLTLEHNIQNTLRLFEMALVDELGCAIDFSPVFDIDCLSFYYIPQQGFIPAIQKQNLPCYHQQCLMAIANNQLDDKEVQYTFKLLMRQVISTLLGDKPLHSRKLFN